MNAGQYVIRGGPGWASRKRSFHQATSLRAGYGSAARSTEEQTIAIRYNEHTRDTGRDVGPFKVVEGAGWDRRHLIIGDGRVSAYVPATAAGVKSALRLIREQEAALLDELDNDIARLEDWLHSARSDRADALREAFNRGNVVRLAEVTTFADAMIKS